MSDVNDMILPDFVEAINPALTLALKMLGWRFSRRRRFRQRWKHPLLRYRIYLRIVA